MSDLLACGPLTAEIGDRTLYRGVELRLPEERLTAMVGPTGAGKTTLLRQVVGLAPAPGAVRRLGGELHSGMPPWRSREVLSPQGAPTVGPTVEDDLLFPFRRRGAPSVPDPGRVGEALAAAGLGGIHGDRPTSELSGGERHRLALARALLWDPPVLLADEPLAGLDEESARDGLSSLLRFARRPGHAVLAVLHDSRLSDVADARIHLECGELRHGEP